MKPGRKRISKHRFFRVIPFIFLLTFLNTGPSAFPSSAVGESENRIIGELEKQLLAAGLVNVKDLDDTLIVELKYACPSNFMGENVYGQLTECYLQPEAARQLKKANDLLKRIDPGLRIVVVDGFRPRSVQRRMWELVKGTPRQKYVANPSVGSMHNYGLAVDVTLADAQGNRLDMGTPIDYFGTLAHPSEEARFLEEGKLTKKQVASRRLLRRIMNEAGFSGLSIEWWHFNACTRKVAEKDYEMID
jgi:zinc D-Ala-D-Ala dipeptidase